MRFAHLAVKSYDTNAKESDRLLALSDSISNIAHLPHFCLGFGDFMSLLEPIV